MGTCFISKRFISLANKDTEGDKLQGLQEIIHSFTTALGQKSIILNSYSTLCVCSAIINSIYTRHEEKDKECLLCREINTCINCMIL